MNLKRFTGRSSREALALVRQAFGEDAVVMSTKPCPEGVEVLAMAPESVQQLERLGAHAPRLAARTADALRAASPRLLNDGAAHPADAPVDQDVQRLSMSTLSFQDYVRERMLKRRRSEMAAGGEHEAAPPPAGRARAAAAAPMESLRSRRAPLSDLHEPAPEPPRRAPVHAAPVPEAREGADTLGLQREQREMLLELRSMRGLIEQRFGALAFMEKMQRQPRQALLTHRLLECGFSPALVRKLIEGLPADGDETDWAASVLQRNLLTGEDEGLLEDQGGVYALIGATGVGKTTSTAKLAAAFAAKHGAGNLGLITLDAYRVAAHEQLRAYGRILGVPVHTAHDRASLDDLLELLANKRMVLIDTAGMAQRDARTKELLDMLNHRAINRLLVINAAAQGETVEDVLVAYRAANCRGAVLSKIDEAMKLGPALDAMIRHKVKVLAVANGQRVPEDWHRMSAQALVQRALRAGGSSAWKFDNADVNLVFTAQPPVGVAATSL